MRRVQANPGRFWEGETRAGLVITLERLHPERLTVRLGVVERSPVPDPLVDPPIELANDDATSLLRGLAEMLGYELGDRHEV